MATSINTDSIVETINAFVPVLIVLMFVSAMMKSLGKVNL